MRLLLTLLVMISSVSLFAEDATVKNEGTGQVSPNNLQKAQSIEKTEEKLDEIIAEMNKRLQNHTKLFRMKVTNQPYKTFVYKGKANGENCEKAENQEDPANNCLKLEVFDFVGSDEGRGYQNLGSKNKYIVLFYEGTSSNEDPRLEEPRKVTKVISQVYLNDFIQQDIKISEVADEEPENAKHEKVFIFYQHDGNPPKGTVETKSAIGIGRYNLTSVENTKTNPIRNSFKKRFYIKHLDYFDKLFTYIFDANEQNGNKRYKEANENLKNSLKY
ncbi:MAG: hypothetical protein H7A25_10350 [Leptospiraceae bacterium]|nr:hypothetical protein [Leptospiraceae bacterium]MCP5500293.1 hypothetical protein [Leptospiraceae bacterium]